MPLPDESPRQSVANLIGRFEQQVKRKPLVAPASPSVSANADPNKTGDGLKEEIKERKEWLPRYSIPSKETSPPPVIPSSSWSRAQPGQKAQPAALQLSPAVQNEAPQVHLKVEVPTPTTATAPAIPIPDPAPEPVNNLTPASSLAPELEPEPTPAAQRRLSEQGEPTKPTTSRNSISSARASSIRSTTNSINNKPTPKEPSGSIKSSRSSVSSSPTQPTLKPQLTGQSTTSTSTARSSKANSRANLSTPARAKTPSALTPRPKTPSSGLYAPTAASLARARNAAPDLPTPVKKASLSNSTTERLSKPTAASKARSTAPAAAAPAARGPQKSMIGKTPTKGVLKGKSSMKESLASDKEKAESEVKEDESSRGGSDIGHDVDSSILSEGIPSLDLLHAFAEGETIDLSLTNGSGTDVANGNLTAQTGSREPTPSVTDRRNTTFIAEQDDPAPFKKEEERLDEVKRRAGGDLEDIVNVLEGTTLSKARPLSLASIPDEEVEDIPDEE